MFKNQTLDILGADLLNTRSNLDANSPIVALKRTTNMKRKMGVKLWSGPRDSLRGQ